MSATAKISRIPIIINGVSLFIAVILGGVIAYIAYIYDYTFTDLWNQAGIAFPLLFATGGVSIFFLIVNILRLSTGIEANERTITVRYLKGFVLKKAVLSVEEVEKIDVGQSIYEKPFRLGTIHICLKQCERYSVYNIIAPFDFVQNALGAIAAENSEKKENVNETP